MSDFRRNHYVPCWYQKRFLPPAGSEHKLHYLDLRPEVRQSGKRTYRRKELRHLGPKNCFEQLDLYTQAFGSWESTKIEQVFFGEIDRKGQHAVDYLSCFQHPSASSTAFQDLVRYLSTQKLRTPKGLADLSNRTGIEDRNSVLQALIRLQQINSAVWTECIWNVVDASDSPTKFLVSDHPVTVYNQGCFPGSRECRDFRDPDISQSGTHTLFPLDRDKLLILTNLSWVRNPYGNPLALRPNPYPFRSTVFNFLALQTLRKLTEDEVKTVNFILKKRAYKYVAAEQKEWLYPERDLGELRWDKIGESYLLMPDPRSVPFSSETVIGFDNGRSEVHDEYGRQSSANPASDQKRRDAEWESFHTFQGEYARLFGPARRGRSFVVDKLDPEEDTADFHQYHLRCESHFRKPTGFRRTRKRNRK